MFVIILFGKTLKAAWINKKTSRKKGGGNEYSLMLYVIKIKKLSIIKTNKNGEIV